MTKDNDMTTFIEGVRDGKYSPGQIDDWVEAWHESGSEKELHETLGMSWEQYGRWAKDPNTLVSILGEHGVVAQNDDLKIEGLKIGHNISGREQESSFMNACLVGEDGNDVSIAATAPAEYHKLSPKDFNAAIQQDLAPLIEAGWSFEIQKGPNDEKHEDLLEQMTKDIES